MLSFKIGQFSFEFALPKFSASAPTTSAGGTMPSLNSYLIAIGCAGFVAAVLAQGRAASGQPVSAAGWGSTRSSQELESKLDEPGPLEVESVAAATWQVPLEGLLNLDHPRARAAGLKSADEPITIYFHALKHPTRGLFIVDTGVERALKSDPERSAVSGIVAKASGVDRIEVELDLATWLTRQPQPLAGVFLTHLHLDHIMGMPDVPRGTPIFIGPGETSAQGFLNFFTRPTTDRVFEGHQALAEWRFQTDPTQRFAGVIDVFDDGSLWALHVPGHTPGSTAYLARTPQGPVLMVGDACHTAWGWKHQVEPGTFSSDRETSAESLAQLENLVKRHPNIDVRLGHQAHDHD
jgi:N-acyl homoserine lactone hydrolase